MKRRSIHPSSFILHPFDEAVYFLLHFPGPCGRWALPTTVSFGARTFLSPHLHRRAKPAANAGSDRLASPRTTWNYTRLLATSSADPDKIH